MTGGFNTKPGDLGVYVILGGWDCLILSIVYHYHSLSISISVHLWSSLALHYGCHFICRSYLQIYSMFTLIDLPCLMDPVKSGCWSRRHGVGWAVTTSVLANKSVYQSISFCQLFPSWKLENHRPLPPSLLPKSIWGPIVTTHHAELFLCPGAICQQC